MIKWEEFEHIHVVKRIREILGNWFKVDVFFVDDQGHVRNFEPSTKRVLSNPLLNQIFKTEKGFEHLKKTVEGVNAFFTKNDVKKYESELFKDMWSVAVPIVVDHEYYGFIYAATYWKDKRGLVPETWQTLEAFGLKKENLESALSEVLTIKEGEQQHFFELVDLVSQEIVTLHKEITLRENRIHELNSQLGERHSYSSMVGKSKPMLDLYALLDKISGTDSTILIQGENGTGKELIAKAVHYNSPRKDRSFLAVNCAAFNDNLLESELFGHVKGSFTGAIKDRKGYFESANGGTLFLDEIGDISQAMQVKLLRVLQDGTFTPVGSTEQRKVNVRIIAATNRNLKQMVEQGTFRQDLYFRLNVIGVSVPALRERKEDIPLLVDHFLNKAAKEKNIPPKTMSKRAMQKLFDYHWPGNIRELENEMERVTVLAGEESIIVPDMLSPRIREAEERPKVQGARLSGKLKDALEELEKNMIREGLRRTNWNKSQLAKELGISRAGLIMKVEKYGLDKRKLLGGNRTGTED